MGKRKYTLETLKKLAREHHGEILSKKYTSINNYYEWKCQNGHKWKASGDSVKRGSWCNKCYQLGKEGKKLGSYAGWSEAKAKDIIGNYTTYKIFAKKEAALNAWLRRNKIHKKLTKSLIKEKKNRPKYTIQELQSIAKKYQSKRDFREHAPGAYSVAEKRGITKKITSHMENTGSLHQRAIYIYEFDDKSVYVGLTYNYSVRYREHTKYVKGKRKSTVLKKILKGHKFKYYEQHLWLNKKEAVKSENWWIRYYRKIGWKILNIAPAGSLGGGERKWSKDIVLQLARECNLTRSMFKKKYAGAIGHASRFGYIKELMEVVSESCYQKWTKSKVLKIAKKYKTLKDFKKNEKKAASAMYRLGLSKEVKNICPSTYKAITKKEILSIAQKYKGNTRTEFIKKERNVHYHAKRLGILDQVYRYMIVPKAARSKAKKK